ncbi:MAG: efflux RND transporter permease subunit [Sphaerochaetaceae bacterium]|mgnify:CR=1 FL=1|jgi:HAE1 family hydrophobic/amphiphilic exporter-1|nr:efflux RND transporter permease subunit [Sphaerochaetaceae bacterium]NLO59968.1 efflux RND transporter permease subunit [Spirochaetales bacterium]MDD2405103.1 efflux RND transporter permease subunit [Sphaerochaetaceae bacterium]MDD3670327.1 efflux RND transporter permease subunit [Sphaerochaetaceae bacterium]MDD4258977.1 efflux RND transporter permease subunit [Sphaerochaetaceae bacterium]
MRISHFAARHPAVIGMLVISLTVFGIYSFIGMNIEFMGDLSLPSVEVISIYPGAGALDVEDDVTSILEENLVTLPDFKSIDSVSSDSFSWITVTFRDGIDPYAKLPEIRDRIRQISTSLPSGLQGEPTAIVGGATMLPIFMFSVEGGSDTGRITDYLETSVIPRLTQIPGVANVEIEGGKRLQMIVKMKIEELQSKSIPVLQVQQAIMASNTRLPAGETIYRGNRTDVRFDGSYESAQDLEFLPVGSDDQGTIIRLSDVADISLGYAEEEYYVDSDGKQLLVVSVTKRSDGNTLNIASQIKSIVTSIEEESNGALTCTILSDDSRNVGSSLTTVVTSGLIGVLMAIIVIFLFLADTRATLIISFSIPMSILFALIGMKLVGISINLLSLSGIVIALGMVVDGSIVMLEQVYRHYKSGQMDVESSIIKGADEIGSSILASTLTTIVVFIPITFLPGIVGLIIKDVAATLILALTASLIVALIVIPFLLRVLLNPLKISKKRKNFSEKPMVMVERGYRRVIAWSLNTPRFVLITSVTVLLLTVFIASFLGFTFIPSTDNGDFYVDMQFARGTTLEVSREKAMLAERLIRKAVPEIETMMITSGKNSGFGFSTPEQANARILLIDPKERSRSVHEIILDVQRLLSASLPGTKVKVTNGGYDKLLGFVSGGGGYGLTLIGEDLPLLYEEAKKIEQVLANDPDVISVEIDTSFDSNTLVVDAVHDLMGSVGVSSYEAALTTSVLFYGTDVGQFTHSDQKRYDIRLESNINDEPLTLQRLALVSLPTLTGDNVALTDISNVRTERTVSQINHSQRAKTITISATLVSEDASGINSRMNAYLEDYQFPQGISSKKGGIIELIGDSLQPLASALSISLFLVYAVMVMQFERFRQPLIVMVSVPFCFIGVVLGLLLFGSTVSLLAVTGVIALGGIVVNNAIILIDYINLLRKRNGKKAIIYNARNEIDVLAHCVVEGASSRIRPILMTTLTTIFGIIPLAISTGQGAEIYAPLGQAIAGGLITSTMITLLIVPVLYYITERRKIMRTSLRSRSNELELEDENES